MYRERQEKPEGASTDKIPIVRTDPKMQSKTPYKVYTERGQKVVYTPQGNRVVFGTTDERMIYQELLLCKHHPEIERSVYGQTSEEFLRKAKDESKQAQLRIPDRDAVEVNVMWNEILNSEPIPSIKPESRVISFMHGIGNSVRAFFSGIRDYLTINPSFNYNEVNEKSAYCNSVAEYGLKIKGLELKTVSIVETLPLSSFSRLSSNDNKKIISYFYPEKFISSSLDNLISKNNYSEEKEFKKKIFN